MSNYLTTDGLKKFSLLPEAPLRPEARGICHICHMVNPALFMHMHLTEYEQCMFVLSAVHLFIDKHFCLAVAKLS